jgi:hypothetical protein
MDEQVEMMSCGRRGRVWRRFAAMVVVVVSPLATPAARVWAAIPNPAPDGSAPGAGLMTTVLGWLKWGGLTSSLAGLLIGGIAMGVGHFGSNYSASSAGRKWMLGGMGAAVLCGLAWTIVTTLYSATGG